MKFNNEDLPAILAAVPFLAGSLQNITMHCDTYQDILMYIILLINSLNISILVCTDVLS